MSAERGELVSAAARPNGEPAPGALAGMAAPESYAVGFDGMAVQPFDEKIRAVLSAPVSAEDVEIKPDGICYLPGVFYRDRLTAAFGAGGWALAPRGPVRSRSAGGGELVVYHGALYALGRFVAEAMGQCVYWPKNAGMTYADAVEGAKTDCITRCCKDLGIARELWDPGWRGQWQTRYATSEMRDGKAKWKRRPHGQKLDAPAASPTTANAVPSSAPTAGAATSVASATPTTSDQSFVGATDTGEAPTEAQLDDLADLLLKQLKWKSGFVSIWCRGRFGCEPDALTLAQVKTATELAMCCDGGVVGERYKAALAKAVAEGRCRP